MSYLKLFWSFFQIGLFSFGGGYAALPLIQDQVVSGHHWLSMKEFADVITISQMTPGPIAINSASFVGVNIKALFPSSLYSMIRLIVGLSGFGSTTSMTNAGFINAVSIILVT